MSVRSLMLLSFMAASLATGPGRAAEHRHDPATHAPASSTNPAAAPSAAVAVEFPAAMRDHTLANMRDHLAALGEIQQHLGAQRYTEAAEIAEQRLGMSSLKRHGAHEVAQFMPRGMQDAGTAMHRAASQFARTAQESVIDRDLQKPLTALATLTQTCVACHAVYRLR